jgi:hypothetical protein
MKKTILCGLFVVFFVSARIVFSQDRPAPTARPDLPDVAQFLEITGTVEIQRQGSSVWTPAVVGMNIDRNTVVSTGFKSEAQVSLGNSKILIRPLTRLSLEELVQREGAEQVNLYLQTGRVRAEVAPPIGGKIDFTIRSPSVTASVRGTEFETDTGRLRVAEGRVKFSGANGQTAYVDRGEYSYIDSRQNRIVTPTETAKQLFSPEIPALNNTGRNQASSPAIGTSLPAVGPPLQDDLDVGVKWR